MYVLSCLAPCPYPPVNEPPIFNPAVSSSRRPERYTHNKSSSSSSLAFLFLFFFLTLVPLLYSSPLFSNKHKSQNNQSQLNLPSVQCARKDEKPPPPPPPSSSPPPSPLFSFFFCGALGWTGKCAPFSSWTPFSHSVSRSVGSVDSFVDNGNLEPLLSLPD